MDRIALAKQGDNGICSVLLSVCANLVNNNRDTQRALDGHSMGLIV